MSRHSHDLLTSLYGMPEERLTIIPHGAPDRPFGRMELFKEQHGLPKKSVLMTFGLLGPGKGLERVIEALPAICAAHPDTIYRIVGATHPTLIELEGDIYRDRLEQLAIDLNVADHIIWDNRFVDTEELVDQLEACDIYVTPYFNLQQSTSGTLSYAVALGKAVVSTPYVHAIEILGGDVGKLIEPNSAAAIAQAVIGLLDDKAELLAMQRRAYQKGRTTIWPRFASAAAKLIDDVSLLQLATLPVRARLSSTPPRSSGATIPGVSASRLDLLAVAEHPKRHVHLGRTPATRRMGYP